MSITLRDGAGSPVELHKDLLWSDEFNWNPVEATAQRTVTGALIVQQAQRVGGRPITLEPEDQVSAAMLLTVVEVLRNWAAVPGKVLTLNLRGLDREVMFRHQDGGFEATPWVHYDNTLSTDFYFCVIRLMEI